jgi:hypothetical protein
MINDEIFDRDIRVMMILSGRTDQPYLSILSLLIIVQSIR